MIAGKITAGEPIVIPDEVLTALGLQPGDQLEWRLDGEGVRLTRADALEPSVADFSTFTEWADELDEAYDRL